mmetsp:Transcript_35370/g.82708  ORF Transcript_35370/g.82708 Transcript_35370/m.82708 type:complete len:95 (-) Transcript_35370:83-367(-)
MDQSPQQPAQEEQVERPEPTGACSENVDLLVCSMQNPTCQTLHRRKIRTRQCDRPVEYPLDISSTPVLCSQQPLSKRLTAATGGSLEAARLPAC